MNTEQLGEQWACEFYILYFLLHCWCWICGNICILLPKCRTCVRHFIVEC